MLQGRHGEQAGILDDHLVIFDHVEEGGDELVVFDGDDIVEVLLNVRENLVAWLQHGGAVGDGVRARQLHHMASFQGSLHARCVSGLDANDLDMRVQQLGQRRYARGQSAATDGNQNVVNERQLFHDFHGNGALARGNCGVVEGMDEGVTVFFGQLHSVFAGFVVHVAVQNGGAAIVLRALDLNERGCGGHDDGCLGAITACGKSNALRMVARRSGNKATLALFIGQR